MDGKKRYNVHGFTALSGLLEHASVLEENVSAAVPPAESRSNASSEVHALLMDVQEKLNRVMEMLGGGIQPQRVHTRTQYSTRNASDEDAVDGVYDGRGSMVTDDGTRHRIPPAYVDKAFLQEGDLMQFTVGEGGMKKFKKMRS
jgi:hypothetical protein